MCLAAAKSVNHLLLNCICPQLLWNCILDWLAAVGHFWILWLNSTSLEGWEWGSKEGGLCGSCLSWLSFGWFGGKGIGIASKVGHLTTGSWWKEWGLLLLRGLLPCHSLIKSHWLLLWEIGKRWLFPNRLNCVSPLGGSPLPSVSSRWILMVVR